MHNWKEKEGRAQITKRGPTALQGGKEISLGAASFMRDQMVFLIRFHIFPQDPSNRKIIHMGRKRVKVMGAFICSIEHLSFFELLKSVLREVNISLRGQQHKYQAEHSHWKIETVWKCSFYMYPRQAWLDSDATIYIIKKKNSTK